VDARELGAHTWPDLVDRADELLLVVPLGSTEQHGPHLPLTTDTTIATALARGLAEARAEAVIAPALPYGSSGEHAGFPGTLSIGGPALTTVLVELVRSADHFRGVVFVCGHGGNLEALRAAVEQSTDDGRSVLAWWPRVPEGDAHAGRTETSILLALEPSSVRLAEAVPGDTRPLADVLPLLRDGGVAAVSPTGVLGDPTGATADEGRALLATMVADLAAAVEAWSP
jgi:creatinine amidohydrolase